MVLEAVNKEAKPLDLKKVSWAKTKVQVFRGLQSKAGQYVHACGMDLKILENFTYHGTSSVYNRGKPHQETLPHGVMDLLNTSILVCVDIYAEEQRFRSSSCFYTVLLHGC